MKRKSKILSLLLLFGIVTLPGCFTASSQLENIKNALLKYDGENFSAADDSDVGADSDTDYEDEFNISIGPVTLFFTYGLVYFLSPLDEVDFDMAKDVLNNIDGVAISNASFKSDKEIPDNKAIEQIKSELNSYGYSPLVINREKNEINLIFISNNFDEEGGRILVINFSQSEMNLVTVEANFVRLMEVFRQSAESFH